MHFLASPAAIKTQIPESIIPDDTHSANPARGPECPFQSCVGQFSAQGEGRPLLCAPRKEGSEWGGREVGEDSVLGGQKGDGEGGSEANTGRKAEGTVS